MDTSTYTNTKIGIAGGTVLGFVANISGADILRTVLLTTLGAVVSFSVSLLLKTALKWYQHHRPKP